MSVILLMIIGIVVMLLGILVLVRQILQENQDHSDNEMERYLRERDGAAARREVQRAQRETANSHRKYRREYVGADPEMRRSGRKKAALLVCAAVLMVLIAVTVLIFNFRTAEVPTSSSMEMDASGNVIYRIEYDKKQRPLYEYSKDENGVRETFYENGQITSVTLTEEDGDLLRSESYVDGQLYDASNYEGGILTTEEYYEINDNNESYLSGINYYDRDGAWTGYDSFLEDGTMNDSYHLTAETGEYIYRESDEISHRTFWRRDAMRRTTSEDRYILVNGQEERVQRSSFVYWDSENFRLPEGSLEGEPVCVVIREEADQVEVVTIYYSTRAAAGLLRELADMYDCYDEEALMSSMDYEEFTPEGFEFTRNEDGYVIGVDFRP